MNLDTQRATGETKQSKQWVPSLQLCSRQRGLRWKLNNSNFLKLHAEFGGLLILKGFNPQKHYPCKIIR